MRKKVFAIFVLINICFNSVYGTVGFADFELFPSKKIQIIYDKTDNTAGKTAHTISDNLVKYHSNIELIEVNTAEGLKKFLIDENWINVYVFHGSQDAMSVGKSKIFWENIADIVKDSPVKHHVFESCNSIKIKEIYNSTRLSGIGNNTDVEIVKIHALTSVMNIFEDSEDEHLEEIALKMREDLILYVVENLLEIISLTVSPSETLDNGDIRVHIPNMNGYYVGPWGWFINATIDSWINRKITPNDWYHVEIADSATQYYRNASIYIDENSIADSTFTIDKDDLGKGDGSTKEYPFDIPLEMNVVPQVRDGPFWMEETVDLELTNQEQRFEPDFTGTPVGVILDKTVDYLGGDLKIECEHNLWGTVRVGNLRPEIVELIGYTETPVRFLGGGYSASTMVELDIPVAVFLNFVVPSAGSATAWILDKLGINVDLVCVFDLIDGISYDSSMGYSSEHVLVRFGIGFQVEVKLPTAEDMLKKVIGFSPPLSIVKLGVNIRGLTGVEINSEFTPKEEKYGVDVLYEFGFNFWIKLFWFFKFSWGKTWQDEPGFMKPVVPGAHSLIDMDGDGLWDEVEVKIGLDPNDSDTDGDTLSDGNEVFEFLTNPKKADSDGDGINDNDEIALFLRLGLDYLADYDNDGLPCILDEDSDNDRLTDYEETEYYPDAGTCTNPSTANDPFLNRYYKNNRNDYYLAHCPITKWTDPSLPDTDFDGLTDYQERKTFSIDDEHDHPDANNPDTDGDGLLDGFEDTWFTSFPEYSRLDRAEYLLTVDVDGDGLLDSEELKFNTNPLRIDTDGDFDLNGDNLIDAEEQLRNTDYNMERYGAEMYGDLTDYGEVHGNYWPGGPFAARTPCVYPWPALTDPSNADTDGDGSSDREEWLRGENPMWIDSDGDGLENTEEAKYGADCINPDTDGDGLLDGFERDYFRIYYGDPTVADNYMMEAGYLSDPDVDDDQLLDGDELLHGTDILDPDTDNDGLIDSVEVTLGTYPLNPDTDGDTLFDGTEVNQLNTNPKKQDTDNDSLPDNIEAQTQRLNLPLIGEISFNTDPTDPDTDDDGLIDGEEVLGWNWAIDKTIPVGAETFDPPVILEGGKLIFNPDYHFPDPYRAQYMTNPTDSDTDGDGLLDGEERDLVLSPLTDDTDGDGLTDFEEIEIGDTLPGDYDIWHYMDYDMDGLTDRVEYLESHTLLYSQDSDGDKLSDWREHRIAIGYFEGNVTRDSDENSTLDIRATQHQPTSDESTTRQKKTDPNNWDTDGDGLSDFQELVKIGTDPVDEDTDNDGLSDYAEKLFSYNITGPDGKIKTYGLDPLNPDTDGDGLKDGLERDLLTGISDMDSSYEPMGDFDGDNEVNILDPDSDNDGIFDGVEYFNYTGIVLNIFNDDVNANSVTDGMETDLDGDGLSDYTEVYTTPPGYKNMNEIFLWILGHNKYATEKDLLISETAKYFINHTMFGVSDTDGDRISDWTEIHETSTDPLDPGDPPRIKESLLHRGVHYQIPVYTSDRLSELDFDPTEKQVTFNLEGDEGISGFCEISLPKNLLTSKPGTWKLYFDGEEIPFTVTETPEYNSFYFEYTHSVHKVAIQATAPPPPKLPDLIIQTVESIELDDMNIRIAVIIRNSGTKESDDTVTTIGNDSEGWPEETYETPGLSIGESTRLEVTIIIPEAKKGTGEKIKIQVDPRNIIEELDENNNIKYTENIRILDENYPPDKPDNTAPMEGEDGISITPELRANSFRDSDNDRHKASQWQMRELTGSYSTPFYDSGPTQDQLTWIIVSKDEIKTETTYYWRVRHQDDQGKWSEWSDETSFTTMVEDTDTQWRIPAYPIPSLMIAFTILSLLLAWRKNLHGL